MRSPAALARLSTRPSAGVANAQNPLREGIFRDCDSVIVAKLVKPRPGGVLYSLPPTYSTELHFTVEDVFWGPFIKGCTVKAFHSVRQEKQPTYTLGTRALAGLQRTQAPGVWNVILLEGATRQNLKEADDVTPKRVIKDRPVHTQSFAVENAVKADLGTVKLYVSTKRKPGKDDFKVIDLGKIVALNRVMKEVSGDKARYVYAELRIGEKLKSAPVVAPDDQFLEGVTFEVVEFVADKTLKARAVRYEAPVP